MLSNQDRAKVDQYRLLIANVYELAAVSRRESENFAAQQSVTVTQWHTMSVLSGEDRSVPQVARRLGVTRQAVQRVADHLVESGHIERALNPRHGTSPLLHLTPLGERTLSELWELSDQPRAEVLKKIDAAHLAAAANTLREILHALG